MDKTLFSRYAERKNEKNVANLKLEDGLLKKKAYSFQSNPPKMKIVFLYVQHTINLKVIHSNLILDAKKRPKGIDIFICYSTIFSLEI